MKRDNTGREQSPGMPTAVRMVVVTATPTLGLAETWTGPCWGPCLGPPFRGRCPAGQLCTSHVTDISSNGTEVLFRERRSTHLASSQCVLFHSYIR